MLRILIVDDQKSIRETIKAILASESDFEVVATADDGQTAIQLAKKFLPDLMLVDLEMPKLNGLHLTQLIHQDFPSIKVVVLSIHDEDEYIQHALRSGAMGYLLKNTPATDLREAIRFIARGYTQFSPGLLDRLIHSGEYRATVPMSTGRGQHDSHHSPLNTQQFPVVDSSLKKPRRVRKSWKSYLPYWLLGNGLLWGLAILYLLLKPPVYTSKWAISLPSSKNTSSVNIPDIGSVSSDSESPYHNSLFDPREDYKFLLGEKEIITLAAAQVGIKRKQFGEPKVAIVDNTTMMEISVEGNSPETAQRKAIALQTILERKLQSLRQGKISQIDQNLQASLDKSELALRDARQKLADFRADSTLGSRDKAGNLSSNLENLRRQGAETKAQLQQTKTKAQRLADNLGVSSQTAKDAFALHSDSLFQQYLAEYTRMSGELLSIKAKFQAGSPAIIEKEEEAVIARQALAARGAELLGRDFTPELLQQLNISTDNENNSYRGSLLRDIVSLQADSEGLAAQAAELERQIAKLEAQENSLVRQESTLTKLEQDVKFAETVYSSNLAKSRLGESNLYDAYPQIQVAIQPNLPEKPSSPNPVLVGLGTFMGSVFLTTAIASLWASSTTKTPSSISDSNNNNNRKALLPNSDLTSLLKK